MYLCMIPGTQSVSLNDNWHSECIFVWYLALRVYLCMITDTQSVSLYDNWHSECTFVWYLARTLITSQWNQVSAKCNLLSSKILITLDWLIGYFYQNLTKTSIEQKKLGDSCLPLCYDITFYKCIYPNTCSLFFNVDKNIFVRKSKQIYPHKRSY